MAPMNNIWETQIHYITLQKGNNLLIVLELLAPSFFRSCIEKTPEYMKLLFARVVHFTCVIIQSGNLTELDKGVNVMHFSHDMNFTQLLMWAHWKDDANITMHDT